MEFNLNVLFYGKYEFEEVLSYEILMRIFDVIEKGLINFDKKIVVFEGRIRDYNYIKVFEKDGLIKDGKFIEFGREFFEVWCNREFDLSDVDYIRNFVENFVFILVEDIEEFEYEGYVYDVIIEIYNFVVNGIFVYNIIFFDCIRYMNVVGKEVGGII